MLATCIAALWRELRKSQNRMSQTTPSQCLRLRAVIYHCTPSPSGTYVCGQVGKVWRPVHPIHLGGEVCAICNVLSCTATSSHSPTTLCLNTMHQKWEGQSSLRNTDRTMLISPPLQLLWRVLPDWLEQRTRAYPPSLRPS